MKEEDILSDLFDKKLWKGYKLKWCDLCDTAIICCSKCDATSCNCSSCEFCHTDMVEFSSINKTRKDDYLNEQEMDILTKGERLEKFILECIDGGFPEINWKFLHDKGSLCLNDYFLFVEELKEYREEAIKSHIDYGMSMDTINDLKKKL